jgi:hypothetical protein
LFFNVGVEIGQLLFIGVVLGTVAAFRKLRYPVPDWVNLVPPYLIGGVAMFWMFQRVFAM